MRLTMGFEVCRMAMELFGIHRSEGTRRRDGSVPICLSKVSATFSRQSKLTDELIVKLNVARLLIRW